MTTTCSGTCAVTAAPRPEGLAGFFGRLLDTADFPARWQCGTWSPGLGWLHIASDLAIFGAYVSIPLALAYFLAGRRDVPFPRLIALFAAFILACGVGHAVEALIFWQPVYRLAGLIKAVTAVVSWITVVAIVRIIPMALNLPDLARSERDLRASEERFALAVRGSDQGLWDWDVAAGTVYYSPRFAELLGLGPDDLGNSLDGWESRLHPEDRARVLAAIEAHFRRRVPYDIEYRLRTGAGEGRWFHARGQALWDAAGEPARMAGSIADITERKAAEEALAAAHRERRAIMEAIPDMIYVLDVSGRLVRWNRGLEIVTGLSPEELSGRPATDFFPEGQRAQVAEAIGRVFEAGVVELDADILRTDGVAIPHHFSSAPMRDGAGNLIGLAGVGRDVTERRRAEEALRRSEAEARRLALVASRTDNAVILTDPEGRIEWVNDGFTRITEYAAEEVLGRRPGSFLHGPETDPATIALMRERTLAGEGFRAEVVNYSRSGRKYWLAIEVQPIRDDDGRLVHFMAIESDITERRRAEQDLRLLKAAVEQANDVVIVTEASPADGHGPRVVYVNAAFERMTGYGRGEIMGGSPKILQGPGTDRAALDDLRAKLSARKPVRTELRNYRKDGSEFWVELNIRPVADESGRFTHWVSVQRDITARKRSDAARRRRSAAALRESRERLRSVVNAAPIILFALDRDGVFTLAEGRGLAAMGRAAGEFVGRSAFDRYAGHPEIIASLRRAQAGEAFASLTEINGRVLDCRYSPVRDESGEVSGMIVVANDVTERRWAEEAMRRAEARYRDIFENAAEGIFQSTPDGRFLAANPALARILGYDSPADLIADQTDIGARLYVDPARRERFARLAGRGAVADFESEVRRRDGSVVWISERARAVRDESGAILYYEGTAQDVTARLGAERRAHEQAALLDVARDAIMVRGLDNVIRYWNRGAERLYGWATGEAVGRDADTLLFQVAEPPTTEARAATLADGHWSGELFKTARDGREVVVRSRWTLVRDDEGRPASILVVDSDVTETKRLEAQFLRAQRMESLGRIAGGIAHDLNNVLTPITMGVELLGLKVADDSGRKLVATLRKNAERGAGMVQQILAFARGVEGRRVVLRPGGVLDEVERMIRPTLPKSIAIRVDRPGDLWPVRADETQLSQVLMNLCVNARDAMPGGGTLAIAASNVRLDERSARLHIDAKAGPHVVLTVADTGTGIAPEVLDNIFEPFFTTKERGRGTGLGLSTALGIVRGHGGFLKVYSEPGRGTRFSVYLPAAEAEGSEAEGPEAPAAARGDGRTILVIDDEEPILEVARGVLEAHGYRVLTAGDGARALELFERHRGDVAMILTDMMMPIMDGPTTIRALRRLDPGVRVIAASGLTDGARAAGAELGAIRAVLPKPYTADSLLRAIADVLAGDGPGPDVTTPHGAGGPAMRAAIPTYS